MVWEGDDNTAPLVDGEYEIFGQRLSATGGGLGANDFRLSDMGPDGNTAYGAFYPAGADALADWARASQQPYIIGSTGADQMVKPWTLNLCLRALADYLELRGEFGLPDEHDGRGSYLAYVGWLRSHAWLDLPPVDTGPRAAYPSEWWFDGRAANRERSVNNWLLLGADAMAYAHRLSGNADHLEWATRLFRAGSRDPWYEDDLNFYAESKETVNSITFGHTFLYEWARGRK